MSELINNSRSRKELLKHMILQLHEGVAPEAVRARMVELMAKIPYGEVVEVEQALINEGLPETEVLRLCDVHTEALEGHIDLAGMKIVAPGHPVDTFKQENKELIKVADQLNVLFSRVADEMQSSGKEKYLNTIKTLFNSLMDVDKHYRRKENLLFPFLEKYGITGPPKVMWGKHDETRDLLKNAINALNMPGEFTTEMMEMKIDLHLKPAAKAITDMIMKEEEILFPMTLDKLSEADWYEVYRQTLEIGYCLYDPKFTWKPQGVEAETEVSAEEGTVNLPSGRFTTEELLAMLNTLPVDITFVDRNDKVKYFSQGKERIFDRNRAILGRDVRMCHPPSSVHIVDQIVGDFKSGKADSAPFWIQMGGKFIHIEYLALRNEKGEYLGTVEMSQDLTEKRALSGDQRLLSYRKSERSESAKKNEQADAGGKVAEPDHPVSKVVLDARPLLAKGIHPLAQVQEECAALLPGEVYEVITPFPPAPMIEEMAAAGYQTRSETGTDGLFHTYFRK
ncbi:MAG: DUF438 domain-containing protein [Alphaproteobacteria bacterium]|nr:DUF438 domain-containing protein [Alphaproteobacteria bacterium]